MTNNDGKWWNTHVLSGLDVISLTQRQSHGADSTRAANPTKSSQTKDKHEPTRLTTCCTNNHSNQQEARNDHEHIKKPHTNLLWNATDIGNGSTNNCRDDSSQDCVANTNGQRTTKAVDNAGIQVNASTISTKPMLCIRSHVNCSKVSICVIKRSGIWSKNCNENHNSKNNQTDYCRTLAEETPCNQASITNSFNFFIVRLSICLKLTLSVSKTCINGDVFLVFVLKLFFRHVRLLSSS